MKHKKNQKIVRDNSTELDSKPSQHGKGKVCSKCGGRKDTKKVGSKFFCKECREEINA